MQLEKIRIWLRPRWWWPLPAGVLLGYRVSTRFNWYAGRVVELLVGNFEETVLRFYARRAEALAVRERASQERVFELVK